MRFLAMADFPRGVRGWGEGVEEAKSTAKYFRVHSTPQGAWPSPHVRDALNSVHGQGYSGPQVNRVCQILAPCEKEKNGAREGGSGQRMCAL